jgi:hypothetical protein
MLKKLNFKWISRIIITFAILCFLISLSGTWWFHNYSVDGVLEGEEEKSKGSRSKEFGTFGVHAKGDGYIMFEGGEINLTFDKKFQYSTNEFHDYYGIEYGHFTDIFVPIFYFVIISLIFSVILFIVVTRDMKNKYKSILLLLGFFITLIAPIFLIISFYNFLPEAPLAFPEDDFMGYEKRKASETHWGPGIGWYSSVIGSILLLVLSIMYYRKYKKKTDNELLEISYQESDIERSEQIIKRKKVTKKEYY